MTTRDERWVSLEEEPPEGPRIQFYPPAGVETRHFTPDGWPLVVPSVKLYNAEGVLIPDEERRNCTPGTRPVGLAGGAAARKAAPICSGMLWYFPNACAALAQLSKVGNDQHNPGEPMHWAYDKSTDEPDCILRHQAEAGKFDTDGVRHSTKVFWRAAAQLERELLAAHPEMQPGKNVKGFKR